MQRRRYLAAAWAALTAGLAGCTTSDDPPADTSTPEPDPTATPTPTPSPSPTPTDTPTPTETPAPASEFQGPTEENGTEVDIQYRDYRPHEVEQIKADAVPFDYREMFRNIENYEGDAVQFDATVFQAVEGYDHFVFLLEADHDGDQSVIASWVGERFLEDDRVTCWGQILGTESYETAFGAANTVPAIALADIELLEETETE